MRGIPILLDEPNIKIAIAEGRVGRIELDISGINCGRLSDDKDAPVVFEFRGPNGFYILLYDHRSEVIEAFESGDDQRLEETFYQTPCLVGFRLKGGRTQYLVIAPIGTLDIHDGGEEESLILTQRPIMDQGSYRVMVGSNGIAAIHLDTKICLVEPRK